MLDVLHLACIYHYLYSFLSQISYFNVSITNPWKASIGITDVSNRVLRATFLLSCDTAKIDYPRESLSRGTLRFTN